MRIYLIILTALLLFTGCRHTASDPAIRQAELLADSLPRRALSIIDSIPVSSLSGHDLFLHHFLKIKTEDKLFIVHRNDSLIKPVLDYAENNRRSVNYPEVLYYAGRVYADLGDYPEALKYYHLSLNELAKTENLSLKAKILSYISGVYYSCYLYDESEYYINRSIRLDSILGDSLNLIYDMTDLAQIYYYRKRYDKAYQMLNKIIALSQNSFPKLEAEQYVDMARIKLQQGQPDSAMILITRYMNNVEGRAKNDAIATAAETYMIAGKPDSAYLYATRLIKSPTSNAKSRGYMVLLHPSLSAFTPKDSIYNYASALVRNARNTLNQNGSEKIFIESSRFNYEIQKRERDLAEQKFQNLIKWYAFGVIALLILAVVILVLRLKNKQQKLNLLKAEKAIHSLTSKLSKYKELETPDTTDIEQKTSIKASLLKQAEILSQQENQDYIKNLQAATPIELLEILNQNKQIPQADKIWDQLLNIILEISPGFKSNMEILTDGQLSRSELEIAILIKYGLSLSSITKILGRSKQAVHSRRHNLGKKIFNDNFNVKDVDALIKVL